MAFDYATTGLPDNPHFKAAAEMCHVWLTKNMTMFGPDRIASFMKNQPVAAAKNIMENCADWSEGSIAVALLGPAREGLLESTDVDNLRDVFGDGAVDLLQAMAGKRKIDAALQRDMTRIFLVEGLSTMHDQLIGRARIDAHHKTRWEILKDLEYKFARVRGQNPALDEKFADSLKKSRAALEALDAGAKKNPGAPKHGS